MIPRIAATALIAALAGGALAGDNLIYNPGFEIPTPGNPNFPQGWNGFNLEAADYVHINDPGAFVRTGDRSIRFRPPTGPSNRFMGFTTNIFLPDGSDLYDPDYVYLGGDVHVSGWYLVPAGQALANDTVGIKLEFRREPPNFSIYTSVEFTVDAAATDGQWRHVTFTFTDEQMLAVGDFPPYATSVSILPFRFFGGQFGVGADPQGTIYWDDLHYFQGDMPGGCNAADLAEPFNVLDLSDITAFVTAFVNQQPPADLAPPVGVFDLSDISAFVTAFVAGCP